MAYIWGLFDPRMFSLWLVPYKVKILPNCLPMNAKSVLISAFNFVTNKLNNIHQI
jgi:hypothetical protein